MFQVRWLSPGPAFQARMMTGWEQDVVTKRWRPSAPRAEPPARRERRRGGQPRGRLPATLLAVDDTCWSCRAPVRAIVSVIVALRHRHSPGVQGGYVSNGCPECDALVGRFRVDDLLAEHLALGGVLADLAVDITVDLLGERVWRGVMRLV